MISYRVVRRQYLDGGEVRNIPIGYFKYDSEAYMHLERQIDRSRCFVQELEWKDTGKTQKFRK